MVGLVSLGPPYGSEVRGHGPQAIKHRRSPSGWSERFGRRRQLLLWKQTRRIRAGGVCPLDAFQSQLVKLSVGRNKFAQLRQVKL